MIRSDRVLWNSEAGSLHVEQPLVRLQATLLGIELI